MPNITIADLANAQLDVTTISTFTNGTAATVTDRLGNVKKTIAGTNADLVTKVAAVETAKISALSSLDSAKTSALGSINIELLSDISAINAAKYTAISSINSKVSITVAEVDSTRNTAIYTTIPALVATVQTSVANAGAFQRSEIQAQANILLASLGYQPPVVYSSGLNINLSNQTVSYSGQTYAPIASVIPFTTSGTFESSKFRLIQGVVATDLTGGDGSLIGYTPAGAGAFNTNIKFKLDEIVSVTRFGAKAIEDGFNTYDSTNAVYAALLSGEAVFIPDGKNYRIGTVGISASNSTLYSNSGGVQAISSTQPCFYVAAANAKFYGVKMRGMKAATDYSAGAAGIYTDASGLVVDRCDIGYFGFSGVTLSKNEGELGINALTVLRRNKMHHNSYGIRQFDTNEYACIEDNFLTQNGFNNAFTNFALDDSCGGYLGAMSNTSIVNNKILNNATGIYVNSSQGSNPDHNKISLNTINHNWVIGLRLQAIKNYVKVDGNIILSNILHPEAPALNFAPTGSAHDLVVIDVIDSTITGGAIGAGSFGDYMPIFGHARCKYVGVHFLGCVPKEMRVPASGTPVHDIHGYTVNADNVFEGNTYAHGSISKPSLMSSTVRTTNRNNLEHVDGAGVQNVDNVLKDPVMATGYVTPGSAYYAPLKFWREGGNTVHVAGTFSFTGTPGAVAFYMPVGFRPAGHMDTNVVNEGSGTVATIRFLSTSEVFVYGATAGNILSVDATFTLP